MQLYSPTFAHNVLRKVSIGYFLLQEIVNSSIFTAEKIDTELGSIRPIYYATKASARWL